MLKRIEKGRYRCIFTHDQFIKRKMKEDDEEEKNSFILIVCLNNSFTSKINNNLHFLPNKKN